MTYILPSPSVTQQFVGPTTSLASASMLPCLIGSLKQSVIDGVITSQFTASLPVVSAKKLTYPGLKALAVPDASSVKISAKNAQLKIANGTGSGVAGNGYFTASTAPTGVLAGDILTITVASGSTNSYVVSSVSPATQINLANNATINYALSSVAYAITRNAGNVDCDFVTTLSDMSSITITSLTSSSFPVLSASSFAMSYIAQRNDLSGFYSVNDPTQLALDMDINAGNPLGLYLGTIMTKSGNQGLAYITPNDTTVAFAAALEHLSTRQDVYLITFVGSGLETPNGVQDNTKSADLSVYVQTESQPNPSFYRAAIVPVTDEATFLYNVKKASLQYTHAIG